MTEIIQTALTQWKKGEPVLVYDADGREEECDFLYAAEFCTPEKIRLMRQKGGGLIFMAVPHTIWSRLGLKFMAEILKNAADSIPLLSAMSAHSLPYDTKSSFSISINHVDTFTGITDNDRSLTVQQFGKITAKAANLSDEELRIEFGKNFRSPGHIPLCLATENILETRFGHTEFACALSGLAGTAGSCVGCEIMGDDGKAKPKEVVKQYALKENIPFLEGAEIIEAWDEYRRRL